MKIFLKIEEQLTIPFYVLLVQSDYGCTICPITFRYTFWSCRKYFFYFTLQSRVFHKNDIDDKKLLEAQQKLYMLTDLYKRFLKFKENFTKNGRTTNNFLLRTIGTIWLGTFNLSNNFSLHFLIMP